MNAFRNPQFILVVGVVGLAVVGWLLRSPLRPPTLTQAVSYARPSHANQMESELTTGGKVAASAETRLPLPALPADVSERLPNVVEYTAVSFRDPFVSLLPSSRSAIARVVTSGHEGSGASEQQPVFPSLKIQGIIWGSRRPQAVIDGDVYDVGDTVQGAKIVDIDRQGVTGEVQGQLVRWVPESLGDAANH